MELETPEALQVFSILAPLALLRPACRQHHQQPQPHHRTHRYQTPLHCTDNEHDHRHHHRHITL
uniref:SFRICE_040387 n=1 Tax=Spodoptera frugiperda TaxID=7108 RepID=A0A2H1W2Y1_SPOFR